MDSWNNTTASQMEKFSADFPQTELCGDFEHYTLARFIFLTIASIIAWLGTCGNLLMAYIFITRTYSNTPPTHYPTVLAILDTLICALYIMLFGIDAAIVYLRVESLFIAYHVYIVPAFVVSRITQLAIPYMLILGTLERFVWISGENTTKFLKQMYSDRGHWITIILTLLCCILLRLPTAFAVVVHHFPNCTDFLRSQSTGPADWVPESSAYHFFDFHLLSIAQTFVPFIVLVAFNFVIVQKLVEGNEDVQEHSLTHANVENGHSCHRRTLTGPHCRQQLEQQQEEQQKHRLSTPNASLVTSQPKRRESTPITNPGTLGMPRSTRSSSFYMIKERVSSATIKPLRNMSGPVRDAIYTTLAIVTSYLISNSLHLILTILERSKTAILRDPNDPMMASTFHTVFSDTVSFVYMFTSAIRIIIYYICNPAIRRHLQEFEPWHYRKRKKKLLSVAVSV